MEIILASGTAAITGRKLINKILKIVKAFIDSYKKQNDKSKKIKLKIIIKDGKVKTTKELEFIPNSKEERKLILAIFEK